MLPTAVVNIKDNEGNYKEAIALLDTASQSSYISEELHKKLNIRKFEDKTVVSGISDMSLTISGACTVDIQSSNVKFGFKASCLIVPQVTSCMPTIKLDTSKITIPSHIKLANPRYFIPSKIDLLIGADYVWDLFCVGRINLGKDAPILQKTRLGWIISGPLQMKTSCKTVHCHFLQSSDIHTQMKQFWEIEDISSTPLTLSKEDQLTANHFVSTTKIHEDGKFIVKIPLKEPLSKLGDSYEKAKARFLSLENKLQANPELKGKYFEFLEEYETLGHMNLCNANHSGVTYYMPHHGVLKEDSLTTKLRVVFDASAPTTSGYSFNDLQRVGPTLQNDIFLILLRFRKYTYGLSSDVQMMYRMIWVDPSQHLLQRILWRADPSKPIQIYELKTVTYGTTSAPYLAIRCMLEIANQIENEQPNIAEIIRNCFYVDDYLGGADDIESAQQICKTLTNALKTRRLILRKWVSNGPTTLKELDPNLLTSSMTNLGSDANTKTLGILWSQQEDVIKCKVSKAPSTTRWTKRSILSCIAQIYDPFGLLSPCIIQAKIMLQKIWLENLTWDESLTSNIFTECRKFHSELKYLQELSIPRHVLINNPTRLELHGFSDACLTSYGACIYIRSVKDEQVVVRLLCAKSKISPLKGMTIPRLEL
jgi:hypothetical protein